MRHHLTRLVLSALLCPLALAGAEYRGMAIFNGMPLPGVTVTAVLGDKTLTAVSDQQGVYSFAELPEGIWSTAAEKPGFTAIKKEVAVGSLPAPTFEMQMLPLDAMQTVAAEAPPAAAPAPAPAEVAAPATPPTPAPKPAGSSSSAAKAKAAAAPATAFQRIDLNATSPSPSLAEDPSPSVTNELTQRAADGFLVNGSANNSAATPFSQAAAFGNNRRRPPRLYTYALSLVDTNSALNAANYSLNGLNTPKLPFNNLTGTFSFGGPIPIPHLPQRSGPQFTLNYSRIENRNTSVATSLMPDTAERQGDFSQAIYTGKAVAIYDPTNGNPFPNNVIPSTRISPQALALLAYYPAPNFSAANYNFQVPLIGNTHTDSLSTRLSKNFLRKNLVSGLFAFTNTRSDSNSQFNFLDLTRSLGINSNASYRRTFTPRFYGTLTYNFSRQSTHLLPFFENRVNVSGDAGITGNNQVPLNWGPPSLQFNQSTISGLSDGTASIVHNQTSSLAYTSSWNHKQHNLTFGGDYRWQQYNTISQSNPRGSFTFSGAATGQTVNGVVTPGTGFDFADFLLGVPDASAIAFGNADKYLRAVQPDLYFQDDWRVMSGFTVLLALRWEYTSPLTEKYGRLVNLDVAPGFTAVAPVEASDPKGPLTGEMYPDSLIRPDYRELEPRIGVAWRPLAGSSMVLRAGYSIGYNTQVYRPFANQMVQQSPLSTSLNVANTPANPLTLANGFYAPPNVTTNTVAIDPNFRVGNAQNWNFVVQRDLPGSLQVVATYNGIKGTHQLQAFAPNTYPDGPVSPSGYTYYTSNANSAREAGILQVRRRMHNGILAQAQYTFSKSIDNASALGGGSLGTLAQNWLDLAAERGPSTFDQRHLVNFTLQYSSGMGVRGGTLLGGWRGRLIKDWTFVSNINLGTGLPLTPIYSRLVPGTGIPGNVRAGFTGVPLYNSPAGYYLNPAAVTAPAPGQWGNAGVDSMTGPGQFSLSGSMSRAFRLTEQFTLNTRIDASNPLNQVVVTQVGTTITNPQLFGYPSAVNAMRTVRLTMRLTF